jgi:hypothetical protein
VRSLKRVRILALSPGRSQSNLPIFRVSPGRLVRAPGGPETMSISPGGSWKVGKSFSRVRNYVNCSQTLLEYLPMFRESPGGLVRAPGGSETTLFLPEAPGEPSHAPGVSTRFGESSKRVQNYAISPRASKSLREHFTFC